MGWHPVASTPWRFTIPTASIRPGPVSTGGSRIRSLRAIKRGDRIEARLRSDVLYRGRVEETAPGLGTVWIRDDGGDARIALSQDDFTFWKA